MTYKTKAEAAADMKKWLATLPKKQGWTGDVWENLGWHWCLMLGPLTVYPSSDGGGLPRFSSLLASRVGDSRYDSHRWSGTDTWAKTPLASADKALEAMRDYIANERETIAEMEQFFASRGL